MNSILTFVIAASSAFLGFLITFLSFRAKGLSHQKLQNLEKEKIDLTEKNAALINQIAVLQEKLSSKDREIARSLALLNEEKLEKQGLRVEFMAAKQKGDELASKLEFLENLVDQQKTQISDYLKSIEGLQKTNAQLASEKGFLDEKLRSHKDEVLEMQKSAKQEFQLLAAKILDEKSEKFTTLNKENITALLNPLNEDIIAFKKKVEETYEKESNNMASLETTIKILQEQSNKVSVEANNLASALKGQSKMQGNWGEMILDSILQQSGLIRDMHYFKEKSFVDTDGKNWRPDFQIHLPDNRLIITDSKVSLVAYDKFFASSDPLESQNFLAQHLKSVRLHVEALSTKKYDDLPGSLDFVIMFMPLEPAYMLAIQHDKQLWSYAYERKIVMVSPTNLIACLKIINDLWKREAQSRNAQEIVKRGKILFDKFSGFVDNLQAIGKNLDGAKKSYDEAIGQLSTGRGHLIYQAEKLKDLGVNPSKKIAANLLDQAEISEVEDDLIDQKLAIGEVRA